MQDSESIKQVEPDNAPKSAAVLITNEEDKVTPVKKVEEGKEGDWADKFTSGFMKNFGILKQYTLQKMGKANPSPDSADFKELLTKYSCTKAELIEIKASALSLAEALKSLLVAQAAFSNSLAHLGSFQKVSQNAFDNAKLCIDIESAISPSIKHIAASFESLLMNPITSALDNEIANADKLLSKLEVIHLDRDSRYENLKDATDPKKKLIVEKEFNDADQALQQLRNDLTKIFKNLANIKNDILFQQLGEFISVVQNYINTISLSVNDLSNKSKTEELNSSQLR